MSGSSKTPAQRRLVAAASALIAGLLLLQIFYAAHRFIHADEAEHFHVLRELAQGKTLFRDVFEHHGPLFHYLVFSLIDLGDSARTILLKCRAVAFVGWLSALALLYWLARLMLPGGRGRTPLLAPLMLLSSINCLVTSIEFRPECLHLPLVLGCLLTLLYGTRDRKIWLTAVSGLLSGLSVLSGPRALFVGVGCLAILFYDISLSSGRERRMSVWHTVVFGLGMAVVVGIAALAFYAADASASFLQLYVKFNLSYHFKTPANVAASFHQSLYLEPALWVLGIVGMLGGLFRPASPESGKLAVYLLAQLLLIPVSPTAYPQFLYLIILPFLALHAGALLEILFQHSMSKRGMAVIALAGLLVCVSYLYAPVYLRPRSLWHPPAWLVVPVVAGCCILFCVVAWRRERRAPSFLVPIMVAWLSYNTLAIYVGEVGTPSFGNEQQLQNIARIAVEVPSDGTVLDGFSGLSFMHEGYDRNWFLHDQIVDMVGRERLQNRIARRMRKQPPDFIIVDRHLRYLWRSARKPAADAPYYDWIKTDSLYAVCAQYRPIFFQRDQMINAPAWQQYDVIGLVWDPVAHPIPLRPRDPQLLPHPSSDLGRSVYFPARVARDAAEFSVAVPLEPQFAQGRVQARLQWESTSDPACSVRQPWEWRCRFFSDIWRMECGFERREGSGATPVFTRGVVTGTMVRFTDDHGLYLLFCVPWPSAAQCVAFHLELSNAVGRHRIWNQDKDFAVQRGKVE